MKTKCPHCNTVQKAPDEATGREALCKSCRQKFTISEYTPPPTDCSGNVSARAETDILGALDGDTLDNGTQQQNAPAPSPADLKAFARRVVNCLPYIGVLVGSLSLCIEYGFWGTPFTLGQMFHWYLLTVVGILCFAWILLRRPWKSRYFLVVLWLLVSVYGLRTFASHDYFVVVSKEKENGLQYHNYYTRWSPRLIKMWIFGNGISMEGPYAYRPGRPYDPQRHGMWVCDSLRGSIPALYDWYWYGTKISEAEWLRRTSR